MGFDFSLNWVGRSLWIDDVSEASPRQQGKIVHVRESLLPADIDIFVRLDDGTVATVRVSGKGRSWDWDFT